MGEGAGCLIFFTVLSTKLILLYFNYKLNLNWHKVLIDYSLFSSLIIIPVQYREF